MDRDTRGALFAEAFGTFLFFFVGMGAVVLNDYTKGGGGLVGVALAHGLVLAVLVSAFGAVSGGHFNPAVTFAVWLTGRISAPRAAMYVAVQLAGAVVAGVVLRLVVPDAAWRPSSLGLPALGPGITPVMGIAIEAILTMVLVVAVFGTAIDPRGPKVGGLAIGFAVLADILMGGPLTGAAMNPARWFGPAIASANLADGYVWIVGPLLGAGIVAILQRLVLPRADYERTPATPAAPEE